MYVSMSVTHVNMRGKETTHKDENTSVCLQIGLGEAIMPKFWNLATLNTCQLLSVVSDVHTNSCGVATSCSLSGLFHKLSLSLIDLKSLRHHY